MFQVLIPKQDNSLGTYFELFCPVNQTEVEDPLFMFHNGTFHRNEMNFKDMCPVTQKEQIARVAFDQGMLVAVDNQTNELVETGGWDMSRSLVLSGGYSMIPWDWEILKLFFTVNNIVPTWIDCKGVDGGGLYYKENGSWSGTVGKV